MEEELPKKMRKARAAARLGDVTKLHMQDFVNGGAFSPFSEEPTKLEVRGYRLSHRGNFS